MTVANNTGARIELLAHVIYCQKGCEVVTRVADSAVLDHPTYWRYCELGTKLKELALKEDPNYDHVLPDN